MDQSKLAPPSSDDKTPVIHNRRELLLFLFLRIRETGKWWLYPILIVIAILTLFVTLTGNSSILPAIYAFF